MEGMTQMTPLDWPLMENNITAEDRQALIDFLKEDKRLTQGEQVQAFENEWSEWVGVKHSVFVNSGSSANLITLAALKEKMGPGEIIVPTLTWVSDIAAVLQAGFTPVFVDVDRRTLGMDIEQIISKITNQTKAVFLTHILGYNALTEELLTTLRNKKILLIEDCCESHGARFKDKRIGSYGFASNFSFYFAHHLSTVEGGMVCTDDDEFYQMIRMFRSHGLVREANDQQFREKYESKSKDLNPQFIFAFPAYNVRSSEINAVLGRNQLPRLQEEIEKRNVHLNRFLKKLDSDKYQTDFALEGCSNYALTLVLQESFKERAQKVMDTLDAAKVEYRRGCSGGGNQLRQPYLKRIFGEKYKEFPAVEHIHYHSFYIGNYPGLSSEKIEKLCALLNGIE